MIAPLFVAALAATPAMIRTNPMIQSNRHHDKTEMQQDRLQRAKFHEAILFFDDEIDNRDDDKRITECRISMLGTAIYV